MPRRSLAAVVVLALAVALGVAVLAPRCGALGGAPEAGAPLREGTSDVPSLPAPPLAAAPSGDDAALPRGPLRDRARADRMRDLLRALFADAAAADASTVGAVPRSATGRPLPPMPPVEGPRDDGGRTAMERYIQERVREDLFPLARQCYDGELEKNPRAAGSIVLRFRIVGDRSIGGVVDEASVDLADGGLGSPELARCIAESMMSVSFGAPPDGARETTVAYPIEFAPDDGDGGG